MFLYHTLQINTVMTVLFIYNNNNPLFLSQSVVVVAIDQVSLQILYLIIMIISQAMKILFTHIFCFLSLSLPYQIMTLTNKKLCASRKINTKQLENIAIAIW